MYLKHIIILLILRPSLICITLPVDCWSRSVSALQDVLTDLSAECENLPIEGVSGACYAHKVHTDACLWRSFTPLWCRRILHLGLTHLSLSLQGISQAAGYIYKKLVNDGILNQAFSIAPVRTKVTSFICGKDCSVFISF